MHKFYQVNNKAQATIEYMLLFLMVAIIVFFSLKNLLPKATLYSTGYFNKASGGIMGDPPPLYPEVRLLVGRIVESANNKHASCNANEYMTGGGCYWDEVESTGHTDQVADRTWTPPLGGTWECDARAGGEKDTYVICYDEDYRCRRLQGARHDRESTVSCAADEYLTGGGCFWDEVQVTGADNVHSHPVASGGSSLGGQWVCHSSPSSDPVDSYAICCTAQ